MSDTIQKPPQADTGDSVITLIRAVFPTDSNATNTNQLYSNGEHQLQVDIEIQKQEMNASNIYIDVPLTEAERKNVTILSAGGEKLPDGWVCTEDRKTEYDLGLINPTRSESTAKSEASTDESTSNDLLVRYLSAGGINSASENLMVWVKLDDGTVYTTFENGTNYKQDLTVNTQVPVDCLPDDMDKNTKEVYYKKWENPCYQRTYEDSWTMKAGLRQTYYQAGGENHHKLSFMSCVKEQSKNSGARCVPYQDIELTESGNGDLAGQVDGGGDTVYLSKNEHTITSYRTFVMDSGHNVYYTTDRPLSITIVDNFGTTHNYTISGGDNSDKETPCILAKA